MNPREYLQTSNMFYSSQLKITFLCSPQTLRWFDKHWRGPQVSQTNLCSYSARTVRFCCTNIIHHISLDLCSYRADMIMQSERRIFNCSVNAMQKRFNTQLLLLIIKHPYFIIGNMSGAGFQTIRSKKNP